LVLYREEKEEMLIEPDVGGSDAMALLSLYPLLALYLSSVYEFTVTHAQSILVAGMICTIVVLMDWLASSRRKADQALAQAEFFKDVLRNIHQTNNGDSNMSKDIGRIIGDRLFSYPEIKRISSRLIKCSLDHYVQKKVITADQRDILAEHLALHMGCWEVYPKKKVTISDPAKVKEAIKERLAKLDKSPVNIPEPPVSKILGFDRFRKRSTA
jgi:hypothetical protein